MKQWPTTSNSTHAIEIIDPLFNNLASMPDVPSEAQVPKDQVDQVDQVQPNNLSVHIDQTVSVSTKFFDSKDVVL